MTDASGRHGARRATPSIAESLHGAGRLGITRHRPGIDAAMQFAHGQGGAVSFAATDAWSTSITARYARFGQEPLADLMAVCRPLSSGYPRLACGAEDDLRVPRTRSSRVAIAVWGTPAVESLSPYLYDEGSGMPRIIELIPIVLDKPRNLLFDRLAVKFIELEADAHLGPGIHVLPGPQALCAKCFRTMT